MISSFIHQSQNQLRDYYNFTGLTQRAEVRVTQLLEKYNNFAICLPGVLVFGHICVY